MGQLSGFCFDQSHEVAVNIETLISLRNQALDTFLIEFQGLIAKPVQPNLLHFSI